MDAAAEAGEVFAGFRQCYAQLLLGNLVKGLLIFLCVIPVGIVFLLIMLPSLLHNQPVTESQIIIVGAVFLLCLIPMIYLQVSWLFALPLIIDRNMDFWTAMKTSWKRVNVHWWQVFGLTILVGLVNLVGMLLCCVGVIFTMPIGLAATMYAYETIFSGKDVSAN